MSFIAGAWALSASAQTDVTSTYLQNADFSSGTVYTDKVYGYGHDGSPWGFQEVEGWTINVVNGDQDVQSGVAHPNSGMAGAIFPYGTTTGMLQGGGKTPPTADPDGNVGNCLGVVAVWGLGGYYYQNVTFPAGEYTINIPVYNQSGTNATTTYFGFYPNSGTAQTMATPTTTGSWTTLTKTFTLSAETTGQIRIGYKSNGSGSGANPHLFIDKVQILFKAVVVKDELQAAITAATNANATLADANLTAAIAAAQAVYDNASASQDDINNAADTLNAAVRTAYEAAGIYTHWIKNADFASTDNWTPVISAQFRDYGNGLIGTSLASHAASTTDATHLGTEYYLATQCRWQTNYSSFTQTVTSLPAGNYVLTYDVQNRNTNTTSAAYDNRFSVKVGGTTYTDEATEWMQGATSWTTHTVKFSLSAAADVTISLGYGTGNNNFASGSTPVLYISHLALNTVSDTEALAEAKAKWQAAWDAADTASNDGTYDLVGGKERADLNAEIAKAEPTTIEGYEEATAALIAATKTFIDATPYWDALDREIGKAGLLGVSTQDAEDVFNDAATTAALALAATQDLKVAEYNYVTTDYPYGVELGSWTTEGPTGSLTEQHWSGEARPYLEQSSAAWGQNSWTISYNQDLSLPAGRYIFKVAGRKAPGDGVSLNLVVKNGETVLGTVNDFPEGDTGRGIDTSGATNFSDSGTYCNGGAGRAFEWRYVKFQLTDAATINVAVTAEATTIHQWVSFCDATVQTDSEAGFALIDYNVALADAQTAAANTDYTNVGGKELADLTAAIADDATLDKTDKTAIEAATQALKDATAAFTAAKSTYDTYAALTKLDKITANIGVNPFQYNATTNDEAYTAYEAQFNAVAVDDATTASALQGLLNEEAAAREAYLNQPLNAPDATKRYTITLKADSWDHDGKAITYIANGRTDMGQYNIQYLAAPNVNYAQAFILTPVTGVTNGYTLSQTDVNGVERYISTGAIYGGDNNQIRTTTEADQAATFTFKVSAAEGCVNIWNQAAGNYIGSQDAGMYTVNSHIDFIVAEAQPAEVALTLAATKYGTRILPFKQDITAVGGVKFYQVEELETDGETLNLVQVTTLEANVPYIVFAEATDVDLTLTGFGAATKDTYDNGFITGVFAPTTAEVGDYVLQTQKGEQKFFQVKTDDITVPAYRAFITGLKGSTAKSIGFNFDEATGIQPLDALNAGTAVIYNASGVRQNSLQRGLNIVKMQDGSVRKVMVK